MNSKVNPKKQKNKEKVIASEIHIQIYQEGTHSNIYNLNSDDNILFNTYILGNLLNKKLRIQDEINIKFLGKDIIIKINSAKFNEKESENFEEFSVNSSTIIIIDKNHDYIDSLIKDFEDKLNINKNRQVSAYSENELSKEEKDKLLCYISEKFSFNNNKDNTIFHSLINEEENFNLITDLLNLKFKKNTIVNEDINEILLNKNNNRLYMLKGIVIEGISGTGKSNFLYYLKDNYFIKNEISVFELSVYRELSDSNINIKYLKSAFSFAKILEPSVIIIDDIDILFNNQNRDSNIKGEDEPISESSSEQNLLLFSLINSMNSLSSKTIVICTCKSVTNLNSKLTKLGYFDFTISFTAPNFTKRLNIINHILKDFKHNLKNENIEELANKSHGFVYGDFVKLFKEAYLLVQVKKENILIKSYLDECLNMIKPINLKDIILDIPKVKWSEIGGNKNIIYRIRQAIEWPIRHPEIFKKLGITPPNGILLYGPPGCSKTMIAKALATESGLNFFAIKGPELFSKFVGDSEKALRSLFRKAKLSAPSVLFFDEIDAIASSRSGEASQNAVEDKVLLQLLTELDGVEGRGGVAVLGATNRPDILDKAILRPGRFDRIVLVPAPDEEGKEEIFRIKLSKMKVEEGIDYNFLAKKCKNFSGADIAKVCNEAGMLAIENNINCEYIELKYILEAIDKTKPVINDEMLKFYDDFQKNE